MRSTLAVAAAALLPFLAPTVTGCGGSKANQGPPFSERYVRKIELSQTRAEVGKPFTARLTYEDNFIRDAEVEMSGLPEGLRYDAGQKSVVGTARRPGFYRVQIAVRDRVDKDALRRSRAEDRWWTETVTLDIYAPVGL